MKIIFTWYGRWHIIWIDGMLPSLRGRYCIISTSFGAIFHFWQYFCFSSVHCGTCSFSAEKKKASLKWMKWSSHVSLRLSFRTCTDYHTRQNCLRYLVTGPTINNLRLYRGIRFMVTSFARHSDVLCWGGPKCSEISPHPFEQTHYAASASQNSSLVHAK